MQIPENPDFPFPILHVDPQLVIIDKPAGLAVHPGPRTPNSLEDHLPALAAALGQRRPPTLMHRLDRDTSGCLLLARTAAATRHLAQRIEARHLQKTYLALLDTVPEDDHGIIDAPLAKISSKDAGWRMIVDVNKGKAAITHWEILDRTSGLVSFCPKTGRTHQLRVHATLIGGAIRGDPIYGVSPGPMRLHALSLRLDAHEGGTLSVSAPVPPGWPDCQKVPN